MGGTARHTLVALAAAALLAAGCGSRTFGQVGGTVVDARTRQPVVQAEVSATVPGATEVSATTDAQGRFTLRHVSRQARLRVTAGNYQPTEVQLTGELLGVALSPIPVRGVVTSTLTGGGLRATIAGAGMEGAAARADGSFRLYDVRPGDRLTVTAPGYRTASVTIGASREVRVALAADEATRIEQVNQWLRAGELAAVWRYVFRTPKGYGYVDLPADFKARVPQQSVVAGVAARRLVRGFDMRSVTEGDSGADIEVLVFAMDPQFAAQAGFREILVARFARNAGVSAQSVVLPGGATAAYFRPPESAAALLLTEGSLVVVVFGPPEEPIKRFAAAFLAAHQ
jgi:Carboxypeptidase regulatory-like domain